MERKLPHRSSGKTLLIAAAAIVLLVGLAVWFYRHPIASQARRLTLPTVEVAPEGTVRFAVIGDYGSRRIQEGDVAALIDSWHVDFIATVGDNNYPNGAAETIDESVGKYYHQYIAPYRGRYGEGAETNRFFPSAGHRDWNSDDLRPYLDYFELPGNERYYDVVRGPVHLFLLDTDEREPDGALPDSIQGRWLQEKLGQSLAPWKLVVSHHAPYTSHEVEDNLHMRWPFKEWGADAVFSGFFHVYERLIHDDLPYFIVGNSGTWTSDFGEIDPGSQFRSNDTYGAMIVDAGETRITFRMVNRDGEIIDEYTLTAGAG